MPCVRGAPAGHGEDSIYFGQVNNHLVGAVSLGYKAGKAWGAVRLGADGRHLPGELQAAWSDGSSGLLTSARIRWLMVRMVPKVSH